MQRSVDVRIQGTQNLQRRHVAPLPDVLSAYSSDDSKSSDEYLVAQHHQFLRQGIILGP